MLSSDHARRRDEMGSAVEILDDDLVLEEPRAFNCEPMVFGFRHLRQQDLGNAERVEDCDRRGKGRWQHACDRRDRPLGRQEEIKFDQEFEEPAARIADAIEEIALRTGASLPILGIVGVSFRVAAAENRVGVVPTEVSSDSKSF